MSLSTKLSKLDEIQQKRIEAQLQQKFPNSVVVQVFFLALKWMESERIVEESNFAQLLFRQVISVLQEKISKTETPRDTNSFQYLLLSIQNCYGNDAIELLKNLLDLYHFVETLVNEMLSEAEPDHCASNDEVTENESIDFTKEIGNKEILLKENDNYILEIQKQLKEREMSLNREEDLKIEMLNITNENSSYRLQAQGVNSSQFDQSIISLLKSLFGNILKLDTKNKELQGHIVKDILDWKYNQQRAQIGCPVYSFSGFLQPLIPVCDKFTGVLLETHSQIEKLAVLLSRIGVKEKETLEQVENMKTSSKTMLVSFLRSCFIVEKQPPQILPTDKTFSVSLRLLLTNQVLFTSASPTVTCSLHLDDEIRPYHNANYQNIPVQEQSINNVKNNNKTLIYDEQVGSFNVCFEKLSLNKPDKRKTKLGDDKTSKLVTDQKSCLMFQLQTTIGSETVTIEAFSLPIVVIRNSNQHVESEATIFWDNAFAVKNRTPFISPERVPLDEFLKALNNRWAMSNELELKEHHLVYLAKKLFPDASMEELGQCYVTKEIFHKNNMKGPGKFTFWNWFYKAMNLVEKFMLNEWRDGKIFAFIDKREAVQKLNECLPGTFLLRFSDSFLGGISITYKENMDGCNHMWPWTKEELKQKSLSDSLRDLQNHSELCCLAYLYPFSTPKEQAFEQYYSKTDENKTDEFNPRYPKKAPIRVVRYDDRGSTSTSNFSSVLSASLQTSSAPSVAMTHESADGDGGHVSPGFLQLDDDDPYLSQANLQYPLSPDHHPRMDEDPF